MTLSEIRKNELSSAKGRRPIRLGESSPGITICYPILSNLFDKSNKKAMLYYSR